MWVILTHEVYDEERKKCMYVSGSSRHDVFLWYVCILQKVFPEPRLPFKCNLVISAGNPYNIATCTCVALSLSLEVRGNKMNTMSSIHSHLGCTYGLTTYSIIY